MNAFDQMKWRRCQTAEWEENKLPEHSNASEPTENPSESIVATKPVRQEDQTKDVCRSEISPCQSVKGVQVIAETHSKTPVEIEAPSHILVAVGNI